MIEVVIPVYNEQENVASLISGIKQVLGGACRIIVVDDASEDKTAELASRAGAEVIRHPYRLGNGAGIKTGLRSARQDFVLLMDGDGQHSPEDIPKLLTYIDKFDMVVGVRGLKGMSLRNLANKIYNAFASYVTQFNIQDLTCGFRLVKRKTALKFLYLLPNGFSYPSTLTLAFLKSGRTIKYVPVSAQRRLAGTSKIRLLEDGTKFLLVITKIATFFSPLRIFLPVSLMFFTAGLSYYLYTYLTQHRFTNMAGLLFTTSVLVFMLGLISEQISQLRMDKTEEA